MGCQKNPCPRLDRIWQEFFDTHLGSGIVLSIKPSFPISLTKPHGQYDSQGEYYGPSTASEVFFYFYHSLGAVRIYISPGQS